VAAAPVVASGVAAVAAPAFGPAKEAAYIQLSMARRSVAAYGRSDRAENALEG
jgi:hypothetical protein